MQLALARDRLAVFEVAKAGALHCADDRLPTPCGGDAQIFTQVEATATTQRTGSESAAWILPSPDLRGKSRRVPRRQFHGQNKPGSR